jgi:hypothetical protein
MYVHILGCGQRLLGLLVCTCGRTDMVLLCCSAMALVQEGVGPQGKVEVLGCDLSSFR